MPTTVVIKILRKVGIMFEYLHDWPGYATRNALCVSGMLCAAWVCVRECLLLFPLHY